MFLLEKDVEIVDFPYASLHEKMLLDFTSGTASYDVVSVACQWDGEMAPFLEPLDSYISRYFGNIEVCKFTQGARFKISFGSIFPKAATIIMSNCICLSKSTKSKSRACGCKIGTSKPLFNNNSLVAGIFNCISRPALLSG